MPKDPTPAAADLFSWDNRSGRQSGGWSNKLIWGDNKLVLASLKNGPLRKEIEDAGGLKLVYIDPPFNIGADFSFDIEVGGEEFTKQPSIIEEVAYRDTWGKGTDSYLHMMFERLSLMKELLNKRGSIYVHCDWRMTSLLRQALDEIFGTENFQREVIWAFDTKSGYKTITENWTSQSGSACSSGARMLRLTTLHARFISFSSGRMTGVRNLHTRSPSLSRHSHPCSGRNATPGPAVCI